MSSSDNPKVRRLLIHHVYVTKSDLVPACGVWPGPHRDERIAEWNTGHTASTLLDHANSGRACCAQCVRLAKDLLTTER